MNPRGSAFPILLIIIALLLALAGGASFLYQREHVQNIQLKGKIEELSSRQKITESKLEESKRIASDFELRFKEAKAQAASLAAELEQEKSSKQEAAAKLEQVKADLEQQKALRLDLENKLSLTQDNARKIRDQVKVLLKRKADLELKVKQLESSTAKVELGTVVVNSESAAAEGKEKGRRLLKENDTGSKASVEAKPLEGKVLVVNNEFNFIVFDLGRKEGVAVGDKFVLYHGNKYLGDLSVEKVHDSMSAAGFSDELKDKIKENDRVVQKPK